MHSVIHSSPLHSFHCPDPAILIEADGADHGKRSCKAMTWPLMDDDALPSSYITKVLTCLSKWRVKMTSLMETFDAMEDGQIPESMKMNLSGHFKVQCFFHVF